MRVGTNGGDAVVVNGSLSLVKSFAVGAVFTHYFTPTVAAYIGGTYGKFDFTDAQSTAVAALTAPTGSVSGATVAGNMKANDYYYAPVEFGINWTPVKGLVINPSITYAFVGAAAANTGIAEAKKSDTDIISRIRVTRSF